MVSENIKLRWLVVLLVLLFPGIALIYFYSDPTKVQWPGHVGIALLSTGLISVAYEAVIRAQDAKRLEELTVCQDKNRADDMKRLEDAIGYQRVIRDAGITKTGHDASDAPVGELIRGARELDILAVSAYQLLQNHLDLLTEAHGSACRRLPFAGGPPRPGLLCPQDRGRRRGDVGYHARASAPLVPSVD
jgi:hypothetical protein